MIDQSINGRKRIGLNSLIAIGKGHGNSTLLLAFVLKQHNQVDVPYGVELAVLP